MDAIPHLFIRLMGIRPEVFMAMVTGCDSGPVESKIWLNCKPFQFTMFTDNAQCELDRLPDIQLTVAEGPNLDNSGPHLHPIKMGTHFSSTGIVTVREYTPATCMDCLGKVLMTWYKLYLEDHRVVRRERERMMC